MRGLMTVYLKNVRLSGYHGLDYGEDLIGGEYEVNVSASYQPSLPVESIDDTVDYSLLLELVKERMAVKTDLLETLAACIASEIIAKFSLIQEVAVSVSKLHPPILNFHGEVGVSFSLKRN